MLTYELCGFFVTKCSPIVIFLIWIFNIWMINHYKITKRNDRLHNKCWQVYLLINYKTWWYTVLELQIGYDKLYIIKQISTNISQYRNIQFYIGSKYPNRELHQQNCRCLGDINTRPLSNYVILLSQLCKSLFSRTKKLSFVDSRSLPIDNICFVRKSVFLNKNRTAISRILSDT